VPLKGVPERVCQGKYTRNVFTMLLKADKNC